jgi:3,4-dihydroxy 2-butanone 4-phosphate synthase/3,4-dihydroxy 2-butanone 4-phosphate synthase/GTP cyclohydrolase II
VDDVIAKGSIAVNGVSLTVAEVVRDRFSVALIPLTLRETTLSTLSVDARVNLEADLFVKSAHELHTAATLIASRSFAALPWAGELRGAVGVEKTATQLAAGGAVIIHDPDREAEADVVFGGARLRPESMVFLLTQVCGHTTIPCDRNRLDRLGIPPMPGTGDRHGTAYHVSVDLAAGGGTGVSAHDRAATVRRLAHPDAAPSDFLRPGHVFPLAGRPGGLSERRGHTEASLALCDAAGLPTVAAICEVMGPDGHMVTGSAVERFALRWGIPMIAIDELAAHL